MKLGYSAVISASVMVVMFPVQYFMSERLGKAQERALVGFYKSCRMLVPFTSVKHYSSFLTKLILLAG